MAFRLLEAGMPVGHPDTTERNINVNGKDVTVNCPFLSYARIVHLAGFDSTKFFTVAYDYLKSDKKGGSLLQNQEGIKCESGMVFNVADTSNA